MGKSSINGPFSMAMLNNQRVYVFFYPGLTLGQLVHQYWKSLVDLLKLGLNCLSMCVCLNYHLVMTNIQ